MLEWMISASILTLIVIGLRFLLRGKISLRLQYALWALVLLRLLVPFSIGSSALSAQNLTAAAAEQTIAAAVRTEAEPTQRTQTPFAPAVPEGQADAQGSATPLGNAAQQPAAALPQTAQAAQSPLTVGEILRLVWLSGVGLVGLFLLLVNLRFYVQVKRTRRELTVAFCKRRVYVTEAVDTPCLFGLLRPAVYVTPTAAQDETRLRHTVAHELTHLRHGDAWWSLLRGLCLALHWYNPLVWWAAFLSRRDSELACDEATVKRLGEDERAAYGRTLIDMTCKSAPPCSSPQRR